MFLALCQMWRDGRYKNRALNRALKLELEADIQLALNRCMDDGVHVAEARRALELWRIYMRKRSTYATTQLINGAVGQVLHAR